MTTHSTIAISYLKLLKLKSTGVQLKSFVRAMSTEHQHFLTLNNINPNLIKMKDPLYSPLVTRTLEVEKELKNGVKKPYGEVLRADLDDHQALGQTPITFIRQVISMVFYPALLDDPKIPKDAKDRAQTILSGCRGGSIGSYTDATGIEIIRKHAAKFIEKRDGVPCKWENVILCGGSGDGIKKILKLFIKETNGKMAGVMIPIPHYSLYPTTLDEYGLHQIGYYLDELKNWKINVEELQRSIEEAKKVSNPKVLAIVNPGNPTGHALTRNNIEEIIRFAYKENLYLIADEVYQDNICGESSEFHSFKKVLTEMGKPYTNMELASFMSCSAGHMGESGFRTGFIEILNMCPNVKAMFYKANTAMLCPTVAGQACVEPIVRPPEKGEPSYDQYAKEKEDILNSLKVKTKLIVNALNSLEGVTCNEGQGSIYAFPQLKLPMKAVEAAKKLNQSPDTFYCNEALENTGISILPGEEFGQLPGTYHFRTTTLLPINKTEIMLDKLKAFHREFLNKYS